MPVCRSRDKSSKLSSRWKRKLWIAGEARLPRANACQASHKFAILTSMSSTDATLPIIEKSYSVYKQLIAINSKLEKSYRYGLGASAEQSILSLLELLFMAGHAPKAHKAAYLLKAQAQLDVLRLKLRLYLELKLANETKIFQMQSDLQEIGRMLGGWLKSVQ